MSYKYRGITRKEREEVLRVLSQPMSDEARRLHIDEFIKVFAARSPRFNAESFRFNFWYMHKL